MIFQVLNLKRFGYCLIGLFFLLTGCVWANQELIRQSKAKQNLCADLARITELPMKDDMPVSDRFYLAIRDEGKAAIPCLVDHITNETPMKDPRSAPTGPSQFKVGDLAFFLLIRTGEISFEDVLPEEATPSSSNLGITSYFIWVSEPGNRSLLQRKCKELINLKNSSQ